MDVKLFVLGNPGTGKSTVARYIIEPLVRDCQWLPVRINDYEILREMFLEDAAKSDEDRRFKAAEHNGFNVLDFTTFDGALQHLQQRVEEKIAQYKTTVSIPKPLFTIIEFARNDYQRAFQQFNADFLQNAFVLYLDTDLETCKRRIGQRIANQQTEDDYYVPNSIFETYYDRGNDKCLTEMLEEDFKISKRNMRVVNNNAPLKEVEPQIREFIQGTICKYPHVEKSVVHEYGAQRKDFAENLV